MTAAIQGNPSDWINEEIDTFHRIRGLVQTKIQEDSDLYDLVRGAIAGGKLRVTVPISFFTSISPAFTRKLLTDPFSCLPPSETALGDVARSIASLSASITDERDFASIKHKQLIFDIHLGIKGWLGSHSVSPRGLSSRLANKLVCVEGIITKCSLVHPRLTQAVFYIPEIGRHVYREHTDTVAIVPKMKQPTGMPTMTKDDEGHEVEMEYGLSFYKDSQKFCLQEMPESTPTGQLPRSMDVICEHDLVDCTKPGDRVRIWGVMRTVPVKDSVVLSGFARSFLVANNVELLNLEKKAPQMTPANIKAFKEIASRVDTLDLIASSIAPSINGHDLVKRGLALQLVGGERKVIEGDGSTLRGDIHILLIGDPSCGKSQLLRFVMNLAPLAVSTTGRGSSAVGLTAAVVSDTDTGERRLEAGAMVLADGGMVCIDEFDKMGFDDRVAVHEVMEQQRVSINKAGISASLNARTSVLAAANPIYGLFDDSVDFARQVNFPDSLLSRFDLIYIIRESSSASQDRKISSQVLGQLRTPQDDENMLTAAPGQRSMRASIAAHTGGLPALTLQPDTVAKKPATSRGNLSMWTTMIPSGRQGKKASQKVLKADFLRKYILYCKSRDPPPSFTEEAMEEVAEFYASLRNKMSKPDVKGHRRTAPTPRLLEACVRLATAHAKLKLQKTVELSDVAEAKRLITYTMMGEDLQNDNDEAVNEPGSVPLSATRRRRAASSAFTEDEMASVEEGMQNLSLSASKKLRTDTGRSASVLPSPTANSLESDRMQLLRTNLQLLEAKYDRQEWEAKELQKVVNKKMVKDRKAPFEDSEWQEGLKKLQKTNVIMIVSDRVYFV